MNIDKKSLNLAREIVGNITSENIKYIDSYVIKGFAIFSPTGGACEYALAPSHTHPSYMFVIAFDETSKILLNNKIIGSSPYTLFGLKPGIPHQELKSSSPPRYFAIMVNPALMQKQLGYYPVITDKKYEKKIKVTSTLLDSIKRFTIEYENNFPGRKSLLHSLSIEIIHQIIRCYTGLNNWNPDKVSEKLVINKSIEYMYCNLHQKVSLDQIASSVNYSTSHFVKLFKLETAESPIDYLNRIRLEKAKKMVLNKNHTITDVAFTCGFSSSSYFSKSFSTKYGQSPSSYRKKFIKADI